MYLIMTTYRQDIMTTFSWVRGMIDLLYLPIFQSIFPKYTQAYMSLSTEVSC